MAPKLAVEQVFERFREFATALFDNVAEPRSVVLVVDWQIGQTDFPPGLLVTREEQVDASALIDIAGQLCKMNTRLVELYSQTINKAEEVLQELKKEVEELERRKSALQRDTAS